MNHQQTDVDYVIGFDPGGRGSFGWAVLARAGLALAIEASGTCDSAREAVTKASQASPAAPVAISADAPLYWSLDGDRQADQMVRRHVIDSGGQSATVAHVNSLRGACLVQGLLCVELARRRWPAVPVTEAHPKALLSVCSDAQLFVRDLSLGSQHERDAALAAFTGFKMLDRPPGWRDLLKSETGDLVYPVGKDVSYWFPTEP